MSKSTQRASGQRARPTMGRRLGAPVFLLAALFMPFSSQAQPAPKAESPGAGRQLLEDAYHQRRSISMRTEMKMTLVEGSRTWERTAVLFSKRQNEVDDFQLIRFTAPPEMSGSSVLTREQHSSDDAQWVYVPAYHTVRRIPPSNRGDAYLGTDYFYEDVLDPRWDEYSYKLLGEAKVDDMECTQVETTPTSDKLLKSTAYSRTVYCVEPKLKVIVQQEFYDKSGKLLKRLVNSKLKQYGPYQLWDYSVMENVQTKHKTITEILKREVDGDLDDNLFTQKALKRGR